jgi:prephenate dehydrogenase
VGIGLLGGSMGLALRQRRLATSVAGFVRRTASVKECERRGVVDRATRDLQEAVTGADLIILCTPIAQMRALVEQMRPWLAKGAIVTDVGSVKKSVVEALSPLVAGAQAHFVGSHPMAGSEKTGVAAARADLYANAVCVVTPTSSSNSLAVRRVAGLWNDVGSRVLKLTPEIHDEVVSRSSHLPHVIAAQLANLVLSPPIAKHQAMLCANGFRDTTRIASGSPEMWRDIALANRLNLVEALEGFQKGLAKFRDALKAENEAYVTKFFEQAKERRDKWSRNLPSSSPE